MSLWNKVKVETSYWTGELDFKVDESCESISFSREGAGAFSFISRDLLSLLLLSVIRRPIVLHTVLSFSIAS